MAVAVTAAAAATGLAIAAGLQIAGPVGAVAPAIAVMGVVLLRFPGAALALLLASAILIEPETPGLLPAIASFYDVAGASLTPSDVILLAGMAGIVVRFALEGERPSLPEPFVAPLALLALAVLGGVATGYSAAADAAPVGELFHRSMTASYLILVPLLAVNVLRDTRALRIFAVGLAALAAFKGLSGLYAALGGVGTSVEDETISYLSPAPNLIMLTFALGVVAALVRRLELPTWMIGAAPICLLALLLSYRRSFWIAALLTLVVVVILASRRRGRTVAAVAAAAVSLALVATMTIGSSEDPSANPFTQRVQTLSPSGIGSNRGDRYRMDERTNVVANIEDHPLTGVGLGVPWSVHQPLAEDHDRRYAHVAVLWFWLSLGPLGVIAYLALLGTALWAAVRVWRQHDDPYVKVAALAAFGAVLALLTVELTATFTGVEARTSLVLGGIIGWLAAAWRELPRDDPAVANAARQRG